MNELTTSWITLGASLWNAAATWWLQAAFLSTIGFVAVSCMRSPVAKSITLRVTMAAVLMCPLLTQLFLSLGLSLMNIGPVSNLLVIDKLVDDPPPSLTTSTPFEKENSIALGTMPKQVIGKPEAKQTALMEEHEGQAVLTTTNSNTLPESTELSDLSASSGAVNSGSWLNNSLFSEIWLFIGLALSMTWCFGSLVMFLRLGIDLTASHQWRRQSVPADDVCKKSCDTIASKLGIRQRPIVLVSPFLASPCLIGHWNPAILLPEDIEPSDCDPIFLHELAHLRRGDWLWNVIGRFAQAILWCQPLIGRLHRQNLSLAEDICDDYVLQNGCNRESYLRQLLGIASRTLPSTPAIAVSMIGFRSKLGRRAVRILDTTRSISTQASPCVTLGALVSMILVTTLVASIEIEVHHAAAAEPSGLLNPTSTIADSPINDARDDESKSNSSKPKLPSNALRTYSGTVLGPNGKPVAGATVAAIHFVYEPSGRQGFKGRLAETKSASDGSYSLQFQPQEGVNKVVAEMKGFAVDAIDFEKLEELYQENRTTLDLNLASLKPIKGRIVDTEGNPVPNVSIQVVAVELPSSRDAVEKWQVNANPELLKASDDFVMASHDPRITATRFPGRGTIPPLTPIDKEVMSDADGRFQLDGIGENYLVHIRLQGQTIAIRDALIVGRDMPSTIAFHHQMHNNDYMHYGATPTIVTMPTQRITGVVRDADTGAPIPRSHVALSRFGKSHWLRHQPSTIADTEGRFELLGAPLGGQHLLMVQPDKDQPYFESQLELPATTTAKPQECQFELRKTKWISGRVTDVEGKPLRATIHYYPFRDNPHALKYPNFDQQIMGHVPDDSISSDQDGSFRIRAIAGPGVLAACISDHSLQASYIPNITPDLLQRIGGEQMPKLFNSWSANYFDAMVQVEVDPNSDQITQDLQLKQGQTKSIRVKDTNGNSLEAISILGSTFPPRFEPSRPLEDSSVEIIGLYPEESRLVVLKTPDGNSGKLLSIDGNETMGIGVQLEPCATVIGRVLGKEDRPEANVQIHVSPTPEKTLDNWSRELEPVTSDENGNFQLRLPPGGRYRLWAYTSMGPNFSVEIRPTSGATYAIGDLKDGMELDEKATDSMRKSEPQ